MSRSKRGMVIRIGIAAALLLAGMMLSRGKALSATITVDTNVDEPLSDPDNVNCTLREAIEAANTDAPVDACLAGSGADTVDIPADFYLLTEGEIVLSSELTLDGQPGTYISGGDSQNIFRKTGSSPLTMQDLTLQNGVSAGGGCFEQGSSSLTTLSNVVLKNCNATGRGGAISSQGDLIITDSLLQNNTASGDPSGNNSGGAIYTTSNLTITRTMFNLNSVDLSASPGQGGAIHFLGTTLVVEDSTFERNEAVAGGAISGNGTINASIFYLNSASNRGGAIQGSFTVTNSTFSGNDKGGIYSSGTTVITNSTFYANTGAANIGRQAGTAMVKNTMLYATSGEVNCSNSITSAGFNFDNNNTCGFAGPGDIGGTNPQLGALAQNGGPTRTHALLPSSPAIDAGTNTGCPSLDQRGFPRPKDGDIDGTADCDIGAYEYKPYEIFLPLIMR